MSFPLIFLGFGFLIGPQGLGLIELEPHDPTLEVVATLTLALVLFLDAVKLQVDELGKRWLIPLMVLGPGTVLIIALNAITIALLIGLGWLMAFIGGAILASTDPVVLREVLRDSRIPRSVQQILQIEAGMNDIVVLPVILILIAVAQAEVGNIEGWALFLSRLLLVGPVISFTIGGAGAWVMAKISNRMNVRLEYQALYGIGLVLAAYTASTFAGSDGFLGAFAAGLAVTLLNQTLCECFLDYGEVTVEMAMMLAFVLFGVVLSSILDLAPLWQTLTFAVLAIFAIRPSLLNLVLARARLSREARAFIGWFGPRGLNSLLLALDVRSRSTYQRDGAQIPGSVRVLPDRTIEWAKGQPTERSIIAYCT